MGRQNVKGAVPTAPQTCLGNAKAPFRRFCSSGGQGPKERLCVYVMPGPSDGVDEIRQDVYPYATPSLVSYTKPGQPYFGTKRMVGGWYVAGPTLKDDLMAVGLRATAPPVADDAGREIPWEAFGVLALLVALAGLGFVAVRSRRRSDAAPA